MVDRVAFSIPVYESKLKAPKGTMEMCRLQKQIHGKVYNCLAVR